MRSSWQRAAWLSLVLWGGAQSTASAYVRTREPSGRPLAWKRASFTLTIGSAAPRGLDAEAVARAARAAARSWNEVSCADVQIAIEVAQTQPAVVGRDGKNQLVTHRTLWCADELGRFCHNSLNPALTTVHFSPQGVARAAGPVAIDEVDIELNAVDFDWQDPARANYADLQVVLTHELGHALGLADACRMPGAPSVRDEHGKPAPDCVATPADAQRSVMWPLGSPSDVSRRQLSAEDRRAVCALYPRR